jgi:hypothetical protein
MQEVSMKRQLGQTAAASPRGAIAIDRKITTCQEEVKKLFNNSHWFQGATSCLAGRQYFGNWWEVGLPLVGESKPLRFIFADT